MLHKEIPFLRTGLPFYTGIISGLIFHPGKSIFLILVAAATIIFLISLFFNRRIVNYPYGIFITVIFFLSGNQLLNKERSSLSTLSNKEAVYLCRITDYPEEKENTFSLNVRLMATYTGQNSQPVAIKGNILLYHDKKDDKNTFIPGDIIMLKCQPVEVMNRGNPSEFNYRFYLINRGIKYYSYTGSEDILYRFITKRTPLRYRALIMREKIIEMFRQRGLDGERLALVAAVTLGYKNLLDPETKQEFSKAGAMHIMAVSGLNAGILSIFIFNMLFFLGTKMNPLKSTITVFVIWCFAFITGFTPSVARATLMFTFIHAGKMIKREPHQVNSVLASAFVLMLLHPSVVFDTGFQLSYLAVIFIIIFYEKLESKVTFRKRLPAWIWQAICITLIAQAGTLAVTLMYFNRFPVYFLLTNLIVVPVSSLMIIIGFLVIITFPLPFVSQFLAGLLNITTFITAESTRLISSLNFSSIDNIGMTVVESILLTLFIFFFLSWLLRKDSYSIHLPAFILLLLIVTGSINHIRLKISNDLTVYNIPGSTTIGIRTGDKLSVFSNDSLLPEAVIKHSATDGLTVVFNPLSRNTSSIMVNDLNILISGNLSSGDCSDYDVVILTGRFPKLASDSTAADIVDEKIILSSEAVTENVITGKDKSLLSKMYSVKKEGGIVIPF